MESQLDSLDALTFDTENTSDDDDDDDDDDAAEIGKLGIRADASIDEEAGLLGVPQTSKTKKKSKKKSKKRPKKPELKELPEQAGMPPWKIACCLLCTVLGFTVAYILISTMQVLPGQNNSVALVCSVEYPPLDLPPLNRGEVTISTVVGSAVSCAPKKTWLAVTALLQTHSGIAGAYRDLLALANESGAMVRSVGDPEDVFVRALGVPLNGSISKSEQSWAAKLAKWGVGSAPHRLIVAVSGGSPTAGAGGVEAADNWFTQVCRGLDMQMKVLGREPVLCRNGAAEDTSSAWAHLTLDSVIGDADILFWEYSINDAAGRSTGRSTAEHMQRMLELWLRAALALPSKPAIGLVYFWDADTDEGYTLGSSALEAVLVMLQHYTQRGVDIRVFALGRGLEALGIPKTIVLADKDHPNAAAHRLLDLLQGMRGALCNYADWSPAPAFDIDTIEAYLPEVWRGLSAHRSATPSCADLFAPFALLPAVTAGEWLALASGLAPSSLLPWQPQFGVSLLHANQSCEENKKDDNGTLRSQCIAAEEQVGAKAAANRQDRKLAWRLPACKEGNLTFTLETPRLKLYSVAISGGCNIRHTFSREIRLVLNGQEAELHEVDYYDEFFQLWGLIDPNRDRHVIQACKVPSGGKESLGDGGKCLPQVSMIVGLSARSQDSA